LNIWDYLVVAVVGLLVFFTPFASGGVEVWSLGVAEALCFILALLWMVKTCVAAGGSGFSTLARGDFGVLAAAATAFAGLLLFQLVPLPPSAIRIISPHSYELYRNSIPGWPGRIAYDEPAYTNPSRPRIVPAASAILPTIDEVHSGAVIPFAPPKNANDETQTRGPRDDSTPRSEAWIPQSWRSVSVAPILTRAGLLKYCAYAALFFAVVFYPAGGGDRGAEHRFRRVLVLMVLGSGVAVALMGLTQQAFFYGTGLWSNGASAVTGQLTAQRASGPFVNPDHYANYLAMILPLAVAGAMFRIPLDHAERFSGFQLLCAPAALLIAAGIVLSLSRAGWIEIGLSIAAFAFILRHRHRHDPRSEEQVPQTRASSLVASALSWFLPLSIGLIGVAVGAMVLVGSGGRERAGARMAESVTGGVGFQDRMDMWADSIHIVRNYPFFGAGFDSWPTVFPRYQRPPWTMFFIGEAQNDYVEIAAECGIVGMLLLGWLCWKIGRHLYDDSKWIPSRHWALFAALIPAIVVMGFHETLDFCMQIPANALLLVLMVGLAMRLARIYSAAPLHQAWSKAGRIAAPAAIGIAAIAGFAGIANQRETVYPDDLSYPPSIRDNEASILSHPASPIPHLWLADRVHDATGGWLTPELKVAVWLDPTNPAGRDRYVQALLAEGRKDEALRQIARATYAAPNLNYHGYLNARVLPWLPADERDAAEDGLREASANGFEGATGGLAQLYVVQGRQLDAGRLYESAAAKSDDASLKYENYLAAASMYAAARKSDQERRLLRAAINLAPRDPRAYSRLISIAYAPGGDSTAALKVIRTAVDNGLEAAPLYQALAAAAESAGDNNGAEKAIREAVSFAPSYSNWMRLGSFYMAEGSFAWASDAIHHALQINPQSGDAYFALAQAEEGAYQYPAARADYQRAIALDPDNRTFRARSLDLQQKIAADAGGHSAVPDGTN
jgi:tetratricopeptide (TPR) repeat protein